VPAEFLEDGDRERAVDRIVELDDGAAGEYQMVKKDGTSVSVLISSRQIEYGGRPALFSIMRDLTDQR
jgi:PAS domain S-box-containing protein